MPHRSRLSARPVEKKPGPPRLEARVARRRFGFRAWILQGLAALLVLLIFELTRTGLYWGEDAWHAELSFRDYDCTGARENDVCPMHPHRRRSTEASGSEPYTYTTNAAGFRTPEFPPIARVPGVPRVAVFGSSPVFGIGVNDGETLPERLRDLLVARAPGGRVEVLNFGLPMTYLTSAVRAYVAFARAYRPDVVVFVQPEAGRLFDMNYRVRQIHRSSILRWLLEKPWGRNLVNRFQYVEIGLADHLSEDKAGTLLRQRLAPLVEDQRAQGIDVVFFMLYDAEHIARALARALPDELRRTIVPAGWSREEYLASPRTIPRDGHPNAAGQAYFAEKLAGVIGPILDARRNEARPGEQARPPDSPP